MKKLMKTRPTGWCLASFCALAILLSGATCRQPASQAASSTAPFTIVMLPDTQHYSRKYPELFMA